jgi:hypothetical protein
LRSIARKLGYVFTVANTRYETGARIFSSTVDAFVTAIASPVASICILNPAWIPKATSAVRDKVCTSEQVLR